MHPYKIFIEATAAETMELVREIRSQGLVQGQDFDFKYIPRRGDGWTYDVTASGSEFYFREGKWHTYYTLKYGT